MRCRKDTKPLAIPDLDEEIGVVPLGYVEMSEEQLDRAATLLARLLMPIAESIVRDREARERRLAA
jgi:hypothetical protein